MWHNSDAMEKPIHAAKVSVGPQGRLVIPSEIRREMAITPGDVLLAVVDGDRLILEKKEAVLRRLRQRFAHVPPTVSLSEELIAERREAAKREESE
jgi:AbrB family looped-hinge helix DNA binding protein